MSIASISVGATITENELTPITDWTSGEPGVVEVERADKNAVVVHLRHVNSEEASISADLDRPGAVALAHALFAAVEED